MTDRLQSKQTPPAISNEEVVHELTKDLESLEIPELDSNDSKQNSPLKENIDKETSDDPKDSSEEDEKEPIEEDVATDEEDQFKDMSDDDKQLRKTKALDKKDKGNELFKTGNYIEAVEIYTEGLRNCPFDFKKERAIIYSNRAAAKIKLGRNKSAVEDCNKAIALDPQYLRAIVRRATLKEELDQLDEALADWKRVLEIYPEHHDALVATNRLPPLIAEKNEKLKEEMLGKLKSLGNVILRPFGLSTENFKMLPNEEGGYSIQFQQK